MSKFINFDDKLASAIRDGNIELMQNLVRGTWIQNSTLLRIAVEVKNLKIIRFLLNNGTYIDGYVNYSDTVLHLTVEAGNRDMILFLLCAGANVDVKNVGGHTALYLAVKRGSPIIVEDILKCRPYIGHYSNKSSLKTAVCGSGESYKRIVFYLLQYGFTSNPEDLKDPKFLHNAVAKGYLEIVEDQLKSGANVNMVHYPKFGNRGTLLHTAVKEKQEEVAKLLVNYGANLNAIDEGGNTPISYDIQDNDAKITKFLITDGANIKNSPQLMYYAATNGYLKVVEDLLKSGANVNMVDYSKHGNRGTLLHTAVKEKQEEVAKLLVNYGANLNAIDEGGNTPISYDIQDNDAKITKFLITNGANIKNSPQLMYYAATNGYLKVVEDLLKSGANVNMVDYSKHGNHGTLLHTAVKEKQEEVAKLLVNYGANVNAKDKMGNTPVFFAVKNNDAKLTKLLLNNGAIIKNNPEILQYAATNEYLEVVEDLLKSGADVNMIDPSTYGSGTLLHTAVKEKQEEVAKLLVNYGANVNAKDKMGNTPVFFAVKYNDAKLTKLLLNNGAIIKNNPEILQYAATNEYLEVVEDLLKSGADVNMIDPSTYESGTLLHTAVKEQQEEVAKLLVNYGANVNAKDKMGNTPVFFAVKNNDAKLTKLLLNNGAIIKNNPEILQYAATNGYLKVVEDLLKSGADVNMIDPSTYESGTLLHTAVKEQQEEVAKLLVNYGANVNAKDKMGNTPVFFAVKYNDAKLTKLLLNNGAIIKNNPEILQYAATNEYLEVVEDLLKSGADVNMIDPSTYESGTLLHTAVKEQQEEVAKLLVNYGANVNAKDKMGNTPVYYAVLDNNERVTELLLTNGADIEDDPELLDGAIIHGNGKIIDDLLKHGADVHVRSGQLECYEDSCNDALKMLKKMLLVAGLYVSVRNLNWMDDDFEIYCQRECEGEIEIMKCKKISNSCVSFYDILTKNTHQLAMYAKNENIVQALKSADYKAEFPIYASMIEGKLRRGLKRKDLEELGNQSFHSLYVNLPELPLLCIEKIFSYLSNYDLKLLTTCDALNRL